MKPLHLTGKIACALIATVAVISGCQKKDTSTPPVPEASPAPAATTPTTPPVTNTPTTEGGTTTQPNPASPAPDAPTQTTPPATTEPPVKH